MSLLDSLPRRCVLCESPCTVMDLCPACTADLPYLIEGCQSCALPGIRGLCGQCLKSTRPFSAILAPLQYRFPVDVLVNGFKEQHRLAYGDVLFRLILTRLSPILSTISQDNNIVTAVPLHPVKLRRRGFNQSAILARALASYLGWQANLDLCRRVTAGPDLKLLSQQDRVQSIKGAFSVSGSLNNERVILVDDVVTTCTTVTELAGCLLAGGAGDVIVVAAARTPPLAV